MDALSNLPPGMDLMKTPMAANPSGDPPNFVDPPSLKNAMLGVGVSLTIVSGPMLALRLFANWKHSKKFYLDDAWCLLGWICSIAYWAVSYSMAAGGSAGRHAWDTPIGVILAPNYMKLMFTQTFFGYFNMWLIRAAVLVLYIRIFDSVRWVRYTSWTIIVLSGMFYAASIFMSVGYCTPRAGKNWDSVPFSKCADPVVTKFSIASGVANVVTDCITFAMPFPVITGLQLSPKKKFGLLIVFSVAFCTVIASCASLAYRVLVFKGVTDATWVAMQVIITSLCEQFGTVIVGCVPGISSFWSNIFTKTRFYTSFRSSLSSHRPSTSEKSQYTGPHRHDSQNSGSQKRSYQASTDLESVKEDTQCEYGQRQYRSNFIVRAITRTTSISQSTHAV